MRGPGPPRTHLKLGMERHICNPNTSSKRSEVETGESLED